MFLFRALAPSVLGLPSESRRTFSVASCGAKRSVQARWQCAAGVRQGAAAGAALAMISCPCEREAPLRWNHWAC